jgi:sporulation protein YlmC with PRC-barrel domain
MKRLTAAAILLCASTAAFAQTQAPGTASQDMAASGTAASANRFMTEQTQSQWLVGNLWNKKVYDAAGKSIGDVKDVAINNDGKVQAIIVGVGGFLGLGEKNVAVNYDYLQKAGGIKDDRVVLDMSEQQLRSAPDFKRLTSSGGNSSTTR